MVALVAVFVGGVQREVSLVVRWAAWVLEHHRVLQIDRGLPIDGGQQTR